MAFFFEMLAPVIAFIPDACPSKIDFYRALAHLRGIENVIIRFNMREPIKKLIRIA